MKENLAFCLAFYLIGPILCAGFAPLVINTWRFSSSTTNAVHALLVENLTVIDALVAGCSTCEREQCDYTVGYGGSPDENGETTLDALIMDGNTMNVGAVGALRNIKDAIAVAKHVLENTKHTLLVGDQATEFAIMMGFKRESLTTRTSKSVWKKWQRNSCQPNFWTNVAPAPDTSCGPYHPTSASGVADYWSKGFTTKNHDTIGMIVADANGKLAAGTSTNGARHKVPGRVGDSPIPGAGAYADASVGAAAATGDGDVMMRFLPSLLAVEFMRNGLSPSAAGAKAMQRIATYYPNFFGAIIVVDRLGQYGAACHGMDEFPYSVASEQTNFNVIIETVSCHQNHMEI